MTTTKHLLLLLLLLFLLSATSNLASAAPPRPSPDFIRSSCGATSYPALCVQSLSSYSPAVRRNPRQLAHAALTVSAARARSAAALIARLSSASPAGAREAGAVRDCKEMMADCADRLRQSAGELGRAGAGGNGFAWHMSNVETWVSAALTNENTCLDGLSAVGGAGGKVRAAIRKKVVEAAQLTSNALALVNRLGSKQ